VSGICSCSPSDEDRISLLEAESGRFSILFPGLAVRFTEILGRRVSRIAGGSRASASGDLRLELAPGLSAFVSGPWRGMEQEIRDWSLRFRGRADG
jgi:hypothetical protein